MRRRSIFLPLLLFSHLLLSQTSKLDSLENAYKLAENDTSKILILYELGDVYLYQNIDTVIIIAKEILRKSDQTNYQKGLLLGNYTIGLYHNYKGSYSKALTYLDKSYKIAIQQGLTVYEVKINTIIGVAYKKQGDYKKAIQYEKQSLEIAEKTKDTSNVIITSNNIGITYTEIRDYEKALHYLRKALELSEKRDERTHAYALNNIADVLVKQGKYDGALNFYKKSLAEKKALKDTRAIVYTLNGMAQLYQKKGDYPKSIELAKEGIQMAKNLKRLPEIQMMSNTLYKTYQLNNDFKNAFEYLNLYKQTSDSLFGIEKARAVANLEVNAELEKKDLLIEQEHASLKFQQYLTYIILTAFLLVSFLSFFIWKSLRNQRKIKQLVIQKNDEISLQNKDLQELNALKDKLFSVISHDLRGPIGNILSLLELLGDGTLSLEEVQVFLGRLKLETSEVSTMLNNLLFWAKSQMEKGIEANPQKINLNELIEENIRLINNRAQNKEVKIINQVKGDIHIYADREMIKLVIRNLLHNALKFTPRGKSIYFNSDDNPHFVNLKIKDEGVGMSEDMLEKLFQAKTTYLSKQNTKLGKGTGLGLMLSQEFIQENNGKITVESILGEGSTFCLVIPKQV